MDDDFQKIRKKLRITSMKLVLFLDKKSGNVYAYSTKKKEMNAMTELSRKILESYQVRKTTKQKDAFIALLREYFPELQIEQSKFPKCRNLIIGDVENAKLLLTAHYDTCAWLPFPNFITPKSPILALLYSLLISLVIMIPVALLVFLLNIVLHLPYCE